MRRARAVGGAAYNAGNTQWRVREYGVTSAERAVAFEMLAPLTPGRSICVMKRRRPRSTEGQLQREKAPQGPRYNLALARNRGEPPRRGEESRPVARRAQRNCVARGRENRTRTSRCFVVEGVVIARPRRLNHEVRRRTKRGPAEMDLSPPDLKGGTFEVLQTDVECVRLTRGTTHVCRKQRGLNRSWIVKMFCSARALR